MRHDSSGVNTITALVSSICSGSNTMMIDRYLKYVKVPIKLQEYCSGFYTEMEFWKIRKIISYYEITVVKKPVGM